MSTDSLPSWRPGPTKEAVVEFVTAVTDDGSPDYVAEVDRVAVFDNDGTLSTEMPLYTQLAFAFDRAAALGKAATMEELKAGGLPAVLELVKLTHGSISTDDFEAVVQEWAASSTHARFERLYTSLVYQPMLELLAYLKANGFSCWIFSGGGVDFMRGWAPEVFGIDQHQIIGSTGTLTFELADDGKPRLMKGADLAILDDGPQKPISIHQHVGRRPIFAAGNTDGDLPMLQWTDGSPHRSFGLVVHHTDGEREYAYDVDPLLGSGTEAVLAGAAEHDWSVVDMATDWDTIYNQEQP
ncbi:MAG: HAD family hydrolase [Candidatus Microthrix parvicella]|jgi:hypothetical protein